MAIKSLLVAYQGDKGSQNALTFALQMARKYGAAVTGAHVQAPQQYARQLETWMTEDMRELIRRTERDAVAAIESSFRERIATIDPDIPHDWISMNGPPDLLLARASRFFDLLVTGQFEGAIRHGGRAVQPETILRRSGKPVVIVPQDYQVRPFKEEAVVAWDGSASAARALTDAMQILETKKRLDVVSVESREDRISPLADHDIVGHLKRHDINARHVLLQADRRVGRAIMDYCAEHDPDVLVMGAFGRGKLGDLLFGGVSSYVLENQIVPVFMSH